MRLSPERTFRARALYLEVRGAAGGWRETVSLVAQRLEYGAADVEDAAARGDWESEWERHEKSAIDLVREDTSASTILERLITAEAEAYDIYRHATEEASAKPDDEDAVEIWRKTTSIWRQSVKDVQLQSDVVRRLELEVKNQPRWQAEYEGIVKGLKEQYGGKGPQYELLIEQTADIAVRLRRMRESERDLKSTEAYNWNVMLTNAIRRLQTFTESTKTEMRHKDVNDAVNEVLRVVERIVRPAQPILWKAVAEGIRKHMTERRREAAAS